MTEPFNLAVANRIRELRDSRGWTSAELARRAHAIGCRMDSAAIRKVESGNGLTLRNAARIAAALGVTLDELIPAEVVRGDPRRGFDDPAARAAERLGISAEELDSRSVELWGRPFFEERDARVSAGEADASVRSRQAFRGHVSRDLIAELRVSARLRSAA